MDHFTGLKLEHQLPIVIEQIAFAAGRVLEVDPADNAPRDADGYRARVEVNIEAPITQGVMVKTISQGPVWISFVFIGMPYHSCRRCFKIGHDTYYCNLPEPGHETHTEPTPFLLENYSQPQNAQIVVVENPTPNNMTEEARNHHTPLFGVAEACVIYTLKDEPQNPTLNMGVSSSKSISKKEGGLSKIEQGLIQFEEPTPMETAIIMGHLIQPLASFPLGPNPQPNIIIPTISSHTKNLSPPNHITDIPIQTKQITKETPPYIQISSSECDGKTKIQSGNVNQKAIHRKSS
ncbi:hypothetical protein IFM89_003704 [Coptis chinensis]|uniref:Zinc knuckle CX2CX4HX4C domain-containing protein n=1 Tax=Coptis chinensis TaxID=261450 RepID=A0A835IWS0_9MAGN|nr:hypothetical protein IFM89_003704 [Coptis chinensis]